MAILKSILIILACTSSLVLAQGETDYVLARRAENPARLSERASFIGGYALGGGLTTCPSDTFTCANDTSSKDLYPGTCCPTGTFCIGQGLNHGVACCPSSANCGTPLLSLPTCANTTWTLYHGTFDYFCCEPDEIGVFPRGGGLNDIVGLCVPGDQSVPASNLATRVSGASTASKATSSTLAPATTTAAAVTTTSAAASATPTPTKNAGAAKAISLRGVLGGVVGGFVVHALT